MIDSLPYIAFFVCVWIAWDETRGIRSMGHLGDFQPHAEVWPRVSICLAARDEERAVEAAMRSLLALDYPDLEIIAVDDRSEDATGKILDKLAAEDPRLQVVHVTELPEGWLGKNHGLHQAARRAGGDWILFTDGDVLLAPDSLKRALAAARATAADHLAVGPEVRVSGWLLGVAVSVFLLLFGLYCRPWAAHRRGPWHVGVGAFNLVRAAAYRRIGGHRDLALRPDDDMKLGKRLKMGGYRSVALYGGGWVRVEWYRSVRELARGLEKNTFAGFEYNLALVGLVVLAQFFLLLWPFAAVWWSQGAAQFAYAGCVLLLLWLHADQAELQGFPRAYALGLPIGLAIFLGIVVRATWLTLRRGGIEWRGTFYPLEQLRANRVGPMFLR